MFIYSYFKYFDYNIYAFIPFPKKPLVSSSLQYKSFENKVEKWEIARNEPFLLQVLPQCVCVCVCVGGGGGETGRCYPFRELPVIFINTEIVVCKHFQFGRV